MVQKCHGQQYAHGKPGLGICTLLTGMYVERDVDSPSALLNDPPMLACRERRRLEREKERQKVNERGGRVKRGVVCSRWLVVR